MERCKRKRDLPVSQLRPPSFEIVTSQQDAVLPTHALVAITRMRVSYALAKLGLVIRQRTFKHLFDMTQPRMGEISSVPVVLPVVATAGAAVVAAGKIGRAIVGI
jgi:hypothetical protein